MYKLLSNSQRDWDFADALPYLINMYLYNSNAAFIPVVCYLLKMNCLKIAGGHIVFSCHLYCLLILWCLHTNTKFSKHTHICFHKRINQYAKIVHGTAFSSTGTQRSWIEAGSVSVGWGIGLGSHCLSFTNRGLQCTTELFTITPLWLFTVCCTCRHRHRGQNRLIWAGADTGLIQGVKGWRHKL